jgi:RNA polymerase sigma-70 factor (sigma-E family)
MPASYELFVSASAPRLVRAARMLLGRAAEAEDMVQETLIVVHQHWSSIRTPEAAESYAYRTLVRLTRRHLRSARFRREALVDGHLGFDAPAQHEIGEQHEELGTALAALPPRQREAVVLRYFLDFSIDETARVMRCKPGTVKSQASKALAAMRDRLQRPQQPTAASWPLRKGDHQ